jgi:hypothetical protein
LLLYLLVYIYDFTLRYRGSRPKPLSSPVVEVVADSPPSSSSAAANILSDVNETSSVGAFGDDTDAKILVLQERTNDMTRNNKT